MDSRKTPITEDMLEVAELAAAGPGREDELLRSGFDALADALPSDLAAFMELDPGGMVVRAATGERATAEMNRHRTGADRLGGLSLLQAVLAGRDCHVATEPELVDQIATALGAPQALAGPGETLLVPVAAGENLIGLLLFYSRAQAAYGPEELRIAKLCGSLIGLGILATRQADEVERYRDIVEERNRILLEEVDAETDACKALERCHSRIMRRLVRLAKQVAVTDAPILITGETGTGKEVVARAVHGWSRRADAPFLQLNCAALPENLVESELFGHIKGAFSGAEADRPGRFRASDGGTILLDEVGSGRTCSTACMSSR